MTNQNSQIIRKLTQAALMAALAYVGFQFFRIPVSSDGTSFHLGNTFVVLGGLLLGGVWGGLAGAVGLSVADLTSGYATIAPKTFVLKLCIGLIAGLVFHRLFKIKKASPKKRVAAATAVSSAAALAFNVVADPLAGYLYKTYVFRIPQDIAKTLAKISALTTFVNAVASAILATVFYLALAPILKRTGMLMLPKD